MKTAMFDSMYCCFAMLRRVSMSVSLCLDSVHIPAHAALVVCAFFFILAGAFMSTAMFAALIRIMMCGIIMISISMSIEIIRQLNMALSERRSV